MRDVFQIFSIVISLATLWLIYRRKRLYGERLIRDWVAFVFICVLTILYYGLVIYDQRVQDIMSSSDVSSSLRMAAQIALMLYVLYQPPRLHL